VYVTKHETYRVQGHAEAYTLHRDLNHARVSEQAGNWNANESNLNGMSRTRGHIALPGCNLHERVVVELGSEGCCRSDSGSAAAPSVERSLPFAGARVMAIQSDCVLLIAVNADILAAHETPERRSASGRWRHRMKWEFADTGLRVDIAAAPRSPHSRCAHTFQERLRVQAMAGRGNTK
jgi:hypothetical protein